MSEYTETRRNTAFLAVSSESFGIVPDAWPLATDRMLIAADGCIAGGGVSPMVGLPGGGVEEVLRTCFPMLNDSPLSADVLRATFGPCEEPSEHLLTRCCAAAAEAVTLQYLSRAVPAPSEADRAAGTARACHELTSSLQMALDELCARLPEPDDRRACRETARTDTAAVSVCACRVTPDAAPGSWRLDVFSAGDYDLFLMDDEGLAPIDAGSSGPVSALPDTTVVSRSILLTHPGPFALVLLSAGVYGYGRSAREDAGSGNARRLRSLWRLEERLMRVILTAGSVETLGAQATQYLGSMAAGQDSVSGGFLIPASGERGADAAFEDFRHVCRLRAPRLEELSTLLPDAFLEAPDRVRPGCAECERTYALELFRSRPEVETKLSEYAAELIRQMLATPDAPDGYGEWGECPEGSGDPLHRLTRAAVTDVFRRYDRENDDDREQIGKNRALLLRTLREHWVTLRPVLCGEGSPLTDTLSDEAREEGDRRYAACADMNRRLEAMLDKRRAALSALSDILSGAASALSEGAADWTTGRGDDVPLCGLLDTLTGELAVRAADIRREWPEETAQYRRLYDDYLREREALFAYDTQTEDPTGAGGHAVFGGTFAAMTDGRLPAEQWRTCLSLVSRAGDMDTYVNLFRVLPVISERIGVLERDIRRRGAERSCVRELTGDPAWLSAALRAAVYEDKAWGEIGGLIDGTVRTEYLNVVSLWREETALDDRRRAAFAAASAAAARFRAGDDE